MKKAIQYLIKNRYIKWIGGYALIGGVLGFFIAITEDFWGPSFTTLTMAEIEARFQLRETIAPLNFIGGFIILMILCLWMIYLLFQFKKSKQIAGIFEEELEKIYESKIEKAMILSTIATLGSFCWLGTSLALKDQLSSKLFLLFPLALILLICVLQKYIFKYHNQIYPDKTFNLKDIDAQAEYFNKLDEGQKWIVYQACYKTFMSIDQILTVMLVGLLVFNLLFRGTIFPILLLSTIWIMLKIVYFYEVRKYNIG